MILEENGLENYDESDPYPVKCSGCGKMGTSATFEIEEGDRWECPECYEIEEARAMASFNPEAKS